MGLTSLNLNMAHSLKCQNLPDLLENIVPINWELFERVKRFTPENLYEQINGRAEFFLAYDIISLTFASFMNRNDNSQFTDLYIYDMGTPTHAFGVFSAERLPGEKSLDLGREAYHSDANYYVWKGRYYIQIIASEASGELKRIGMELAERVSDFLVDSGENVWGLTTLPLTDRVPDSIQYFKVDFMGLDFMRNTFTARYSKYDTDVTLFLSQRESLESAQTVVDQYAEFAKKYGKGIDHLRIDGVELIACDMGKNYDVIFQRGHLMGGVLSVKDRNMAVQAAIDFWKQLHQ